MIRTIPPCWETWIADHGCEITDSLIADLAAEAMAWGIVDALIIDIEKESE